jgi:hypothetical protein
MLPAEVLELVGGDAAADAWEPVFLLLTVGPDGYSRVCQLSRAEIEADPAGVVRGVLRARRTIANLRRDGRGQLVVVGGEATYYLNLRAATTLEEDDGTTLAVSFAVEATETDTLGIPLRPMMFQSSAYVADRERWDDNRVLLARLAAAEGADETR